MKKVINIKDCHVCGKNHFGLWEKVCPIKGKPIEADTPADEVDEKKPGRPKKK